MLIFSKNHLNFFSNDIYYILIQEIIIIQKGGFLMSEDIKRLNAVIPLELHTEIKVQASKQGKTIAQWLLEAIKDKLEKEKLSS